MRPLASALAEKSSHTHQYAPHCLPAQALKFTLAIRFFVALWEVVCKEPLASALAEKASHTQSMLRFFILRAASK